MYLSIFLCPPPSKPISRTTWSPTIHHFPFLHSPPSEGGVISMSLGSLCFVPGHNGIIMSHTLLWTSYQDGSPACLFPLHSLILIYAPTWDVYIYFGHDPIPIPLCYLVLTAPRCSYFCIIYFIFALFYSFTLLHISL